MTENECQLVVSGMSKHELTLRYEIWDMANIIYYWDMCVPSPRATLTFIDVKLYHCYRIVFNIVRSTCVCSYQIYGLQRSTPVYLYILFFCREFTKLTYTNNKGSYSYLVVVGFIGSVASGGPVLLPMIQEFQCWTFQNVMRASQTNLLPILKSVHYDHHH